MIIFSAYMITFIFSVCWLNLKDKYVGIKISADMNRKEKEDTGGKRL